MTNKFDFISEVDYISSKGFKNIWENIKKLRTEQLETKYKYRYDELAFAIKYNFESILRMTINKKYFLKDYPGNRDNICFIHGIVNSECIMIPFVETRENIKKVLYGYGCGRCNIVWLTETTIELWPIRKLIQYLVK